MLDEAGAVCTQVELTVRDIISFGRAVGAWSSEARPSGDSESEGRAVGTGAAPASGSGAPAPPLATSELGSSLRVALLAYLGVDAAAVTSLMAVAATGQRLDMLSVPPLPADRLLRRTLRGEPEDLAGVLGVEVLLAPTSP